MKDGGLRKLHGIISSRDIGFVRVYH